MDFVSVYPFAPYQFQLAQKVFEAIRRHGVTGLHLARGERSMLDAFQTAAVQLCGDAVDVLVSLHRFYPSIESFLEGIVKSTIDNATANAKLEAFDLRSGDDGGRLMVRLDDDKTLGRELRTDLQTDKYVGRKNDGTASTITLKILRDMVEARFGRRPYGWPDWEVILLVARLVRKGDISLVMNGTTLSLDKIFEAVVTPSKRHRQLSW